MKQPLTHNAVPSQLLTGISCTSPHDDPTRQRARATKRQEEEAAMVYYTLHARGLITLRVLTTAKLTLPRPRHPQLLLSVPAGGAGRCRLVPAASARSWVSPSPPLLPLPPSSLPLRHSCLLVYVDRGPRIERKDKLKTTRLRDYITRLSESRRTRIRSEPERTTSSRWSSCRVEAQAIAKKRKSLRANGVPAAVLLL